jgi:hypothetical protein
MFEWLISVDGGRVIGKITSPDQRAAIEAANAQWPAHAGRLKASLKSIHAALQRAQQRKIEKDLPGAAHHQGGHAVIATHLGVGVRRAAIGSRVGRVDGEYSEYAGCTGSVVFRRPPKLQLLFDHDRRGRAEDFMVLLMSGPLAEARHRRIRMDWRTSTVDETPLIRDLVEFHVRGHGAEAILRYHKYLEARAASWVDVYWTQIVAVAEALGRQRELTGNEVEELIRDTPGPRPTDVLGKFPA